MLANRPLLLSEPSILKTSDKVRGWVILARQYPQGSPMRNHYLTQIIRAVTPKLWRFHTPYYADALQQTWEYFSKKICTTYNPDRASVVTWLNSYLRYRHFDLVRQAAKQERHCLSIDWKATNSHHAIQDNLARDYASLSILDQAIQWINDDPTGELNRIHVGGYPQINCQVLLLLRLPPEKPWKDISTQFGLPISTLASFYQRQCLPRLRQFGQDSDFWE